MVKNVLNTLRKKQKNNKGFSLVELIVVIAIMAVLVGILAPQFIKYVDKSRASTDMQNLQSIKSAVEIYYADNESSKTFALTATGTAISITADDKEKILKNAGLKDGFTLKSGKWSNVSMTYTPNNNSWVITGTNSIDEVKYNLSSMSAEKPENPENPENPKNPENP